jgi:hypothetical protein
MLDSSMEAEEAPRAFELPAEEQAETDAFEAPLAFEEDEEGPAYEMPSFDLDHDVEWDVEKPLSGMDVDVADDAETTVFQLHDDVEEAGFMLDYPEEFDAFSHDAPADEFIPTFQAEEAPEVEAAFELEAPVAEEAPEVEAEVEDPFSPAAEESPKRREVASYDLNDLRALEEELFGPKSTKVPTAETVNPQPVDTPQVESPVFEAQEVPVAETHQEEAPVAPEAKQDTWEVQEAPVASSPASLDPEAALPEAKSTPEVASTPEQPVSRARVSDDFELRVVEPAPKGPVQLDPENDPISRDKLNRMAAERRAYLSNYNHTFNSHVQAMVMTEQEWETPSYARKGMDVAPTAYSKESNLGKTGLSGDKNDIEFRSHNSFLHDNVD